MNFSTLQTQVEELGLIDYKIAEIVQMIESLPQLKGRLPKSVLASLHNEPQQNPSALKRLIQPIVDFFMMEYSLMHVYGQYGKELIEMVNDAVHLIEQRKSVDTLLDTTAIKELTDYTHCRVKAVYDRRTSIDPVIETDPEFM